MAHTALLIERLLQFSLQHSLIGELDAYVARNTLLDLFGLSEPWADGVPEEHLDVPTVLLDALLDDAAARGLYDGEVPALRVNFEARIMGAVMPRESETAVRFEQLRQTQGVRAATDYFYGLCIASNYIRTAQIAKNIKWDYPCKYGRLEITINLTKPEKDPKTIALERLQPAASYPKCMLCIENIGYAGRVNFPARQNHRVVPLTLCGETWYLQYSPYVYYNEHCIVFAHEHAPMAITPRTFEQLFDFVTQFPHYTCGSNADLPIVGGSILSHDHFQGGHYTFAMEKAPVELPVTFAGFEDVRAGIVKWPMSVLRLTGSDPDRLCALADKILAAWRGYTDEAAMIFAETDGVPHNTITPIARRRDDAFELDLVLRNNLTTAEHPLGLYHPHEALHHIKKENIGLIEVMGLAVLPSRLDRELALLKDAILQNRDLRADESLQKHAGWAEELKTRHAFTPENAEEILRQEVGAVFMQVLEDAGVYKCTPEGRRAFLRFVQSV